MSAVYTTVTGVIGTDPRRRSANGQHVLGFRMVCNERRLDRVTGTWIDAHSSWFTVSCFGELAHNVDASVHKGDRVIVHGRVRVREYEDEHRVRRTSVELTADSVGPDLRYCLAPVRPRQRAAQPEEEMQEHADRLARELDTEPRLTPAELIAQRAALGDLHGEDVGEASGEPGEEDLDAELDDELDGLEGLDDEDERPRAPALSGR